MDAFLSFLVVVMLGWVPSQSGQTPEETRVRYAEFARDAATVAFDRAEAPLFHGEAGRVKTAITLLSIASLEGYYRDDVDNGTKRGDSGNSWCLMQVNTGGQRIVMRGQMYGYALANTVQGWSGKDLVEDRTKCFRAALHIARESMKVCGNLSVYATGKCYRGGEPAGTLRLNRAKEAFRGWMTGDSAIQ
jgi:hypothetical protein